MSKKELKCLGTFLDTTYTDKNGKKRRRFYIHFKDPSITENADFPFKNKDLLMIKVDGRKLVIAKVKLVVEE